MAARPQAPLPSVVRLNPSRAPLPSETMLYAVLAGGTSNLNMTRGPLGAPTQDEVVPSEAPPTAAAAPAMDPFSALMAAAMQQQEQAAQRQHGAGGGSGDAPPQRVDGVGADYMSRVLAQAAAPAPSPQRAAAAAPARGRRGRKYDRITEEEEDEDDAWESPPPRRPTERRARESATPHSRGLLTPARDDEDAVPPVEVYRVPRGSPSPRRRIRRVRRAQSPSPSASPTRAAAPDEYEDCGSTADLPPCREHEHSSRASARRCAAFREEARPAAPRRAAAATKSRPASRRYAASIASGSTAAEARDDRFMRAAVAEDATTISSYHTTPEDVAQMEAMERLESDAIMSEMNTMRLARIITDADMPAANDSLAVKAFKLARARASAEAATQVEWWKTLLKGGTTMAEDFVCKGMGWKLLSGFSSRLCGNMNGWEMPLRQIHRDRYHRGSSTPAATIQMLVMRALTDTVTSNWTRQRAMEGGDATAEPSSVEAAASAGGSGIRPATAEFVPPSITQTTSAAEAAAPAAPSFVASAVAGNTGNLPPPQWARRAAQHQATTGSGAAARTNVGGVRFAPLPAADASSAAAAGDASSTAAATAAATAPTADPTAAEARLAEARLAELEQRLADAYAERDNAVSSARAAATAAASAVQEAAAATTPPPPARRSAAHSSRSGQSRRARAAQSAMVDVTGY